MKVLFFISKVDRKTRFVANTSIVSNKGKLTVLKEAANKYSFEHIEKMVKTYDKIKNEHFSSMIYPVKPKLLRQGLVEFEFSGGKSLERIMLNYVTKDKRKEQIEIIENLYKIIDSLPQTDVNPYQNKNYKTVFGNSYNSKQKCTSKGLIDINLDNIMVENNNTWRLIDYEWFFDFPIPINFLKARSLWFFILRHQETFEYISQKVKMLQIDSRYLVPEFIFTNYEHILKHDYSSMNIAEHKFQSYVSALTKNKYPDLVFETKEYVASKLGLEAEMEKIETNARKRYVPTINHLKSENSILSSELNKIKTSNSYMFSKKLSKTKQKLSEIKNTLQSK